ncbi:MAG: YibE/F family protein [Patescibacteria group bacterium]
MSKYINIAIILTVFLSAFFTSSPTVTANETQDKRDNIKAEIVNVLNEEYRFIPGTEIEAFHQTLKVEILEGPDAGEVVEVESDFYEFNRGDRLFLTTLNKTEKGTQYTVNEPDRRLSLFILFTLFTIAVLLLGLKKGIRSLLGLVASFGVIIFLLLPKLLEGAPPVPTAIIFASVIAALAMYITHGFNRVTHSAFLGTTITLTFIGLLSYVSISAAKLSGFSSHEALYLNLQTGGLLDISGLLLGAMIIGVLGILDDVSITQSATVRELYKTDPKLSFKKNYNRALSVGKEHMVSLVNTLALAYAGASLPLLLLFYQSEKGFIELINMEIFATEIIRTMVGSIGFIMAIPITTLFASLMLRPKRDNKKTNQNRKGPHF